MHSVMANEEWMMKKKKKKQKKKPTPVQLSSGVRQIHWNDAENKMKEVCSKEHDIENHFVFSSHSYLAYITFRTTILYDERSML